MLFLYNLSNYSFNINFQLLAAKRVLNKLENKEVVGLIQYFQMFDHFGIKVGLSYCHMPSINKTAQDLVHGIKKDQN